MTVDRRLAIAPNPAARAAARNNAEWCDSLCRAHGIPGRFDTDAWVNPHRTPRYYPDAVSLDPAAIAGSILERIDTISTGPSVKDSFATLELGQFGYQVVHEAEWIYRDPPPSAIVGPADLTWTRIETVDELVAWETAWDVDGTSDRLIRPALLRDPSVTVLGGYVDGVIVAGAIANRSKPKLVGLSNVFTTEDDSDRAWSGVLAYVDAALLGSAVVGYEAGTDLTVALGQGFRSVGPLRIWLREP